MERRFFRLAIDVHVPERWYLSDPTNLAGDEIDNIWPFTDGRPVEVRERMRVPIFRPGEPTDIEFAGTAQTPIVSEWVASVFREQAPHDVQLFPVEVEGEATPYYVLNVARELHCIDDAACKEVQFYTPKDGRPEQVGEYRAVSGLRIDKSKEALERTGIVGGLFDEV